MQRKKGNFLRLLVVMAAILVFSSPAWAGNFQWTQGNGLEGGQVKALAYDGTTFYAGTYGGGVAWLDILGTWHQPIIGSPIGSPFVNAISIIGGEPYACTEGGVFKSSDSGLSWDPFTSLPGGNSSRTMGIVKNVTTYFVATNGAGVWRKSPLSPWQQVNTGLSGQGFYVNTIVDIGGILYIGTNNGVYSATAAAYPTALTWTNDSTGPSGGVSNTTVQALFYDGTFLYAGTNGGGNYWTLVPTPLSWTQANGTGVNLLGGMSVRAYTLAVGPTLYAATNNGIFYTTDSGANWFNYNGTAPDNITDTNLYAVTTDGAVLILTGSGRGAFWSPFLGGPIWASLNSGLSPAKVRAFAINPKNPNLVYAATNGGIYRSADYGNSWAFKSDGLTDKNVTALGINKNSPNLLYAGTFDGNIYFSSDGGDSWLFKKYLASEVKDIKFHPQSTGNNDVWFGLTGGLYRFLDSGWLYLSYCTTNPSLCGAIIYTIAFDPSNPDTIYVGTNISGKSVVLSNNGGDNWKTAGAPATPANTFTIQILVDPQDTKRVYALTANECQTGTCPPNIPTFGGINISEDHATTFFTSPGRTNDETRTAHYLAIDPVHNNKIYVATTQASTIGDVTFKGAAALNDMTAAGPYTGLTDGTFTVTISSTGTPDTFSWAETGGSAGSGGPTSMTGGAQALTDGISITFGATTGHKLGDSWTFTGTAATGAVGAPAYTTIAPGANDMTTDGIYVGKVIMMFKVQIDSVGTPDTYSWYTSINSGVTWTLEASGVSIIGGDVDQFLTEGVFIKFTLPTGHGLADSWTFTCTPALPPVLYSDAFTSTLYFFDDFGLPHTNSVEIFAVNPAYPNILLAGTTQGPYEYEDLFLPAESVSIKKGAEYSNSTAVGLQLNYRYTTKFMRFSNNNTTWSAWMPVGPGASWNLSAGSGLKTVWAQFKDKSGFTTSASDTIFLDKTKPLSASTSILIVGGAFTTGAAQALTLNAADDASGSGIKDFRLSNSSTFGNNTNNPVYSNWTAFTGSPMAIPLWNLKRGGGSALKVYGQFRDYAGNILTVISTATNNTIALPTGFTATKDLIVTNRVNLTWNDNADNELAYIIQRQRTAPTATPYATIKTLNSPALGVVNNHFTDDVTAGAGTYQYRILVKGNGFLLTGPVSALVILP